MAPVWTLVLLLARPSVAADPLGAWNDGADKQAILAFVDSATIAGRPAFVPAAERVAVFDFDGTLAVEQPVYGQLVFCAEEMRRRASMPGAPPPDALMRKVLALRGERLNDLSDDEVLQVWARGLEGPSPDEVQGRVRRWFVSDVHPKLRRPRSELVYEPMRELIRLLEQRGFKVYIVTGSALDYVRAVSEELFGIPKENVIASTVKTRWVEARSDVERDPEFGDFVDKDDKVLEIDRRIGRRPVMAFGNSDGDLAMLAYATSGPRPGFGALVHHDDPDREYAYDWSSPVGALEKGLELARRRGWTLISFKNDWKQPWPAASH